MPPVCLDAASRPLALVSLANRIFRFLSTSEPLGVTGTLSLSPQGIRHVPGARFPTAVSYLDADVSCRLELVSPSPFITGRFTLMSFAFQRFNPPLLAHLLWVGGSSFAAFARSLRRSRLALPSIFLISPSPVYHRHAFVRVTTSFFYAFLDGSRRLPLFAPSVGQSGRRRDGVIEYRPQE